MKMGPGPHLKGLTLMNGAVLPEEFDYFHDVRSSHFSSQPASDSDPLGS